MTCACRDLADAEVQRSNSVSSPEADDAKDAGGGSSEQVAAASRARAIEHARTQQQKQYDELADSLKHASMRDSKPEGVD